MATYMAATAGRKEEDQPPQRPLTLLQFCIDIQHVAFTLPDVRHHRHRLHQLVRNPQTHHQALSRTAVWTPVLAEAGELASPSTGIASGCDWSYHDDTL